MQNRWSKHKTCSSYTRSFCPPLPRSSSRYIYCVPTYRRLVETPLISATVDAIVATTLCCGDRLRRQLHRVGLNSSAKSLQLLWLRSCHHCVIVKFWFYLLIIIQTTRTHPQLGLRMFTQKFLVDYIYIYRQEMLISHTTKFFFEST